MFVAESTVVSVRFLGARLEIGVKNSLSKALLSFSKRNQNCVDFYYYINAVIPKKSDCSSASKQFSSKESKKKCFHGVVL
jgi:hypothetical protein